MKILNSRNIKEAIKQVLKSSKKRIDFKNIGWYVDANVAVSKYELNIWSGVFSSKDISCLLSYHK